MNIDSKQNFQYAADMIKKAKNILLVPHAKMDCDGMSSAIALYQILKILGKNPTAVCTDPVPDAFRFLPSTEVFRTEVEKTKDKNSFLITVDASQKGFKNLEYEFKDGKVNIVISSENNPFEDSDFSFVSGNLEPDLIITLDSGDIQQLGGIYDDNLDLFTSIPVLNIDHHISNTNFGTLNLVEMKNASTTEIIYDLLPYLDERGKDLVDEDIATLLLAGMITDTGSFQHSNTTPKVLDSAADLIDKGARQQEIIKHLFKTKSLATLRLWGRVLTKLKNDPIYRIVWSSVSTEDLQESLAHSDDTEGLIDELLATTPGTEMVILVKEREDGMISTSIRTSSSLVDAVEFTAKFGGGGHRQAAGFKIRERGGKSFEEIVSDIIFEAKNFQAKRLEVSFPVANIVNIPQEIIPNIPPEENFIQPEPVTEYIAPVEPIPVPVPEYIPEVVIPEVFPEPTYPDPIVPEFQENINFVAPDITSHNPEELHQTPIFEDLPEIIPEVPVLEPLVEPVVELENFENAEIEIEEDSEKIISSFGDILSMDHSEPLETLESVDPVHDSVVHPLVNTEPDIFIAPDADTAKDDSLRVFPEEEPHLIQAEEVLTQQTPVEEPQSHPFTEKYLDTPPASDDEFAMFLSQAKEKEVEVLHDDLFVEDIFTPEASEEIIPEQIPDHGIVLDEDAISDPFLQSLEEDSEYNIENNSEKTE